MGAATNEHRGDGSTATNDHPVRQRDLVGRPRTTRGRVGVIAVLCGVIAVAHSLVYVFAVPPWALEDEEQHVDYVLEIRDDHRLPRIDQTIRESIVRSTIAADRWGSLGVGVTSQDPDPAHRGLEGLSYEAYQPPLYYVVLAAIVAPAGHHLVLVMYLGRLFGAVLAGVGAALTALLAARWCRCGFERRAALIAGLAIGAIPAYAEATARINNDTGLLVAVTAALLALTRFVDHPTRKRAKQTGLCLGIAVAMKISGLVLLAPAIVALGAAWPRTLRRERFVYIVIMLLPSLAIAVAWALVSNARYGVFNPVTAVIERIVRFPVLPLGTLARDAARLTGEPFGHWSTEPLVAVATAGFVVVGLVLSVRCPPGNVRWLLIAAITGGTVAGLLRANAAGVVNAFNSRYVLFSYPALVAAASVGWATVGRRVVAALPVIGLWCVAVLFFTIAFHPRFPFRVG